MATDVPPQALDQNPVVRFRVRTLLYATTIVAVLAAIAGPYYRRQSPAAQTQLLVFWGSLAAATALWLPFQWRSMWQMPKDAGEARHVVWAARRGWAMWHKWPGAVLMAAMWFGCIAAYSEMLASRADRGHATVVGAGAWALNGGMLTVGMLTLTTPRPTVLADKGIGLGRAYAPWKYIRHAEWLADRPGVLKFRRLDGDIYVDVPARMRGEVEAFAREKTTFVQPATTPGDASDHA